MEKKRQTPDQVWGDAVTVFSLVKAPSLLNVSSLTYWISSPMRLLFLPLLLAACTPPAGEFDEQAAVAPPPGDQPQAMLEAPVGATLSPAGHATILNADPAPLAPPQPDDRPTSEGHWYGSQHGLTTEEAIARLEAQNAMSGKALALRDRLRAKEKDNFLDFMLEHDPDWSYVFFFRRDPAATLAKYTDEPRFQARAGAFSMEERKAIVAPWNERWSGEGIPFGYGLDAVYPTMDVELGITAADYRAIAEKNGWGTPPPPIVLKFRPEPVRPALDPAVASFLKGYAYEKRPTLMQLSALGMGKVTLEDGCLMVTQGNGKKKVAVFHHETGIALDEAGYLVLVDRMDGSVRARVGEDMVWGAPNAIPENGMIGLEKLRAACPGELLNIGSPESRAAFENRYPGSTTAPIAPPPPPPSPPPPPNKNRSS